jgi:hypothetical protein
MFPRRAWDPARLPVTSITNLPPFLPPAQDRAPGGGWFCFDDTNVEPWDLARLPTECFGGKFVPEGVTQVSHDFRGLCR